MAKKSHYYIGEAAKTLDAKIDGQNLSYLEHLSTEELEEILRQDLFSDDDSGLEPEYIMAVMEAIDGRKVNESNHTVDVDAAWRDFQENYQGQSAVYEATYLCDQPSNLQQDAKADKKTRITGSARIVLRVAVVAAILVALLSVPAFGQENLFQIVARWTQEQFTLRPDEGPLDGQTADGQLGPVPEEYIDFQAALTNEEIEQITIPRYIPEGFQVTERSLEVSPKTGTVKFYIRYQKDDSFLMFHAKEHDGVIRKYEKDSSDVEVYSCGDVDHYLFANESATNTAVWYVDRMEYMLVTDLAATEIKDIIDSMYGGVYQN